MLELMLCSLVTLLPDYLFRRYAQGKRFGREITIYSVWYELRYGISGCLLLTILLITLIFYHHPSTTNATLFFRSVPIVTEGSGRVAEIYVDFRDEVEAGEPIFRIDSETQEAKVETARRKIAEVDAQIKVAGADLAVTEGQLRQARGAYQQALEELETKQEVRARNANVVSTREIERLENVVEGRQGAVDAAVAGMAMVETQIETLLPAERASAESELAQAEVELEKTVIRAGVAGRIEQFTLRVGDVVNPFMRPAGVLIPRDAGRRAVAAAFGQIEAQVLKTGMIAEITCPALPLTIIPMVVADVQPFIASGQIGTSDQLLDSAARRSSPGGVLAFLEPLYEGGIAKLPPGADCIANAYSSNHEELASGEVSGVRFVYLHALDALALVHAVLLRGQTIRLPIQALVLGGH